MKEKIKNFFKNLDFRLILDIVVISIIVVYIIYFLVTHYGSALCPIFVTGAGSVA